MEKAAKSREIAAKADMTMDTDPIQSLVLAIEAARLADTYDARGALHRTIQASHLRIILLDLGLLQSLRVGNLETVCH